jgi:hypothetical protein
MLKVKVDGFRIELAEIEAVYASHPLVKQAVVLVNENKLVAYIQPTNGGSLSVEQLALVREGASRELTHYMMPKQTVVVEFFPQTANGKLDRKALSHIRHVDVPSPLLSSSYPPERDDTMTALVCEAIERVRGVRPSAGASFSVIGVDSLGAILFLRHLSDKLEGYRIDASRV